MTQALLSGKNEPNFALPGRVGHFLFSIVISLLLMLATVASAVELVPANSYIAISGWTPYVEATASTAYDAVNQACAKANWGGGYTVVLPPTGPAGCTDNVSHATYMLAVRYLCPVNATTDHWEGWSGVCKYPDCPTGQLRDRTSGLCVNAANCPVGINCKQESCPATKHPIALGNGNKYIRDMDFSSAGAVFNRIYNASYTERDLSTFLQAGAIAIAGKSGKGWSHSYQRRIKLPSSTAAVAWALRPEGRINTYQSSPTGWVGDADIPDRLIELKDANGNRTGWRYFDASSDSPETYDAAGNLLLIQTKSGLTQTLIYSDGTDGVVSGTGGFALDAAGNPTSTLLPAGLLLRVVDGFNRTLRFGYDSNNHLILFIDPAGEVMRYAFDEASSIVLSGQPVGNNLTTITYPDGSKRLYWYNEPSYTSGANLPSALTGITDENGVRYATYTYDGTGRAIAEAMAGGVGAYGLSYGTNSTVVTDPLNTQRTYNFATILGVVKSTGQSQPGGAGCGASSSAITYDANGNVASRDDFKGNRSCMAHDLSRNLETTRVEGLSNSAACGTYTADSATLPAGSRKTSTQWHSYWRLPVKLAEPGKLTTWIYNGDGGLFCAPAGATVPALSGGTQPIGVLCSQTEQTTGDANGSQGLAATVTGTPRTWSYTYNAYGQVLTADGPRTDVADVTTTAYYDAADPDLGKRGNIASVTNALGQVTRVTAYDPNGRPLALVDPNGLNITLAYDPRGRLKSLQRGTETTTYQYDPVGQLTRLTQPDGSYLAYTYDAAHRLTDIGDSAGNTIHYTLDNAGNRIQEDTKDPQGTLAKSLSRAFDALGRIRSLTGVGAP